MKPSGDEILYKRIKKADHQAFDLLFQNYWKRLFQYAYKLLQDQQQAEDVVQEVLVQLWENAPQRDISNLSGYLFRSVKYQVALIIKGEKWKVGWEDLELEVVEESVEMEQVVKEALFQRLDHSIDNLPEKCKAVFQLHKKEGVSVKDIAASLNLSQRTVENQIHKAMKVLRSELGLFFFIMLTFGY
ncbi:RNA polymerase sigma factor [Algoriphagus litoralis]|uniref:RNA polymerase sigma factor n=1 Tax=Algoriphagus litoralis TaxID=2202829 RepID=UPI000DB908EE|nr:RNA polymerase sigma-70 factor [Algoriphagus litoralis]